MKDKKEELLEELADLLEDYDVDEFLLVFSDELGIKALGVGANGGIIDHLQKICRQVSDVYNYAVEESGRTLGKALGKMKKKYNIHDEIRDILKEE